MSGRRLLWQGLKAHWPAAAGGTLLMIALAAASLVPPLLMKEIVDGAIVGRDLAKLGRISLWLALLYVGISGLSLAANWIFAVTSQQVLHRVRRLVFGRVVDLPLEFLERTQTGYLTARMGEISVLGALFSSGTFRIFVSLLEFVGVLIIMLGMNARLTLVTLGFLPVYCLAVLLVSGTYRKAATTLLQTGGLMSGKLQETFAGMREIKSLGVGPQRASEAILLSDEVARAGMRQGTVAVMGGESLGLITALVGVGVLLLSGRSIIAGAFTLGGYVAFAAYVGKLLGPFAYLMSYTVSIQPALSALDRVGEFLSQLTEHERFAGKPDAGPVRQLAMSDVTFSYPSRPDRLALSGVTCSFTNPAAVSITGPNGAGKTTLVRLLLGYYTDYTGEILVNGKELRELNVPEVRKRFAVVSQDPFLFDGTVRDNLELIEGVRVDSLLNPGRAGHLVEQLLSRLPQGLDTPVGEGGRNLSGGQRQVVAILRAFLKRADVVVFDEASAHLDSETRETLAASIRSLFGDRISLIVTHDPDLARVGRQKLYLSEGRLVEPAVTLPASLS